MYRLAAVFVPVCLAALAGCAPGKSDIDKSIRSEMKSSMGVEITSTDLTKQPDGSYAGTATAANGDVYDVTTDPPKTGRTEWKAIPSQSMVDKMLRTDLETQLKSKVKTLTLNKQGLGVYTGVAVLENGAKMNVTTSLEGKNMSWKAEPAPQ